MANEELFYIGQKALIEKDGKVLVVVEPTFGIDFPGGKIQEGEVDSTKDLASSLKREVKEEVGLDIEVLNPLNVWFFTFQRKTHPLFGKKCYAVLFKCKYISGEVNLSKEHKDFQWTDKNNYEKFNDRSDSFKALEQYFNNHD